MKWSLILKAIGLWGAVVLAGASIWTDRVNVERNLVLIDRVPILIDASYDRVSELQVSGSEGPGWRPDRAAVTSACVGKNMDAPRCARTLMAGVDGGMPLGELSYYLGTLSSYPVEQSIVASYAGEVWYRVGVKDDAVAVWCEWLAPLLRIDKAARLYEAGHTETALLLINSLDPEVQIESGIRRASVVRILVQMALKSAESEDYGAAEAYWQRAAVQHPERAAYHFNQAIALQRQGRFEEALEPLQKAVRLQPNSPSYQLRLAQTLERLGRKEEAKDVARKLLELDPDNEAAKRLLNR